MRRGTAERRPAATQPSRWLDPVFPFSPPHPLSHGFPASFAGPLLNVPWSIIRTLSVRCLQQHPVEPRRQPRRDDLHPDESMCGEPAGLPRRDAVIPIQQRNRSVGERNGQPGIGRGAANPGKTSSATRKVGSLIAMVSGPFETPFVPRLGCGVCYLSSCANFAAPFLPSAPKCPSIPVRLYVASFLSGPITATVPFPSVTGFFATGSSRENAMWCVFFIMAFIFSETFDFSIWAFMSTRRASVCQGPISPPKILSPIFIIPCPSIEPSPFIPGIDPCPLSPAKDAHGKAKNARTATRTTGNPFFLISRSSCRIVVPTQRARPAGPLTFVRSFRGLYLFPRGRAACASGTASHCRIRPAGSERSPEQQRCGHRKAGRRDNGNYQRPPGRRVGGQTIRISIPRRYIFRKQIPLFPSFPVVFPLHPFLLPRSLPAFNRAIPSPGRTATCAGPPPPVRRADGRSASHGTGWPGCG